MYRFLATAIVLGTLAIPAARTHATPAAAQAGMERTPLLQDTARKERREGKGKARREPHPELRRAQRSLETAKKELQHANTDFGGHRVEAIKSIDEALEHIRQAENYDKQ